MGNATSVSPNNANAVNTEKKPEVYGRIDLEAAAAQAPRREKELPRADVPTAAPVELNQQRPAARQSPGPRRSQSNKDAVQVPDIASTQQRIDGIIEKVLDSRKDSSPDGAGLVAGDKVNGASDLEAGNKVQQDRNPPPEHESQAEVSNGRKTNSDDRMEGRTTGGASADMGRHGSEEATASGSNTTDSSGESYTSSSCSGSDDSSSYDDNSDDTFFMPEVSCHKHLYPHHCAVGCPPLCLFLTSLKSKQRRPAVIRARLASSLWLVAQLLLNWAPSTAGQWVYQNKSLLAVNDPWACVKTFPAAEQTRSSIIHEKTLRRQLQQCQKPDHIYTPCHLVYY